MKKILFSVAFAVGICAAFAFTGSTKKASANLYKKVNGQCQLVQCATTGNETCTVETSTTLYTLSECQSASPDAYTGTRFKPF